MRPPGALLLARNVEGVASALIVDSEHRALPRCTIDKELDRKTWFNHILKRVSCFQTSVEGDVSCQ